MILHSCCCCRCYCCLLLSSSMQRGHEWFFLVSLVEDAWRIERGLFLDSFSSSTIMTREIPVVGLFSKGRKVWRNTVWQTRALISLNNGIPLTFHFREPLRSRRSNSSSSRDLSGDVDRVVRRGRREKVKGSLSNTLT